MDNKLYGGDLTDWWPIPSSKQVLVPYDEKDLQPPPSIGSKYKSEFIDGMAKVNDEIAVGLCLCNKMVEATKQNPATMIP